MSASKLECCCGRGDCAYLEHNSAALAELERDVETAARLGQALLDRHESYKVEAESTRDRMIAEMEKLQTSKKETEAENARIVEENRGLLDQLEKLNQLLIESDAQVRTLTTTLQSTQLEVRRLSSSTKRVEQLEEQLLQLENEQAKLEDTLILTQESESVAIQRWRKAECALGDLHDQVDRIEREARKERERHVELIGRLERRRMVERELDTAAGRIKGAAATASLSRNGTGTNVVSHFVRDILKDNASLQQCVTELKEMLHNSNEDVKYLREQLLLHQPLDPVPSEEHTYGNLVPLSEELEEDKIPDQMPQEIHVHHHFHNPISTPSRKEKSIPIHRRQRKRRPVLPPTLHENPSRAPPMSQAMHRPTNSASSIASAFSQASSSLPGAGSALSSIPSSPLSGYRSSSIFDRHDSGFESSRPTSPESVIFSPPRYNKQSHRPRLSDASFRSINETDELDKAGSSLPSVEGLAGPRPDNDENQPLECSGAENSIAEETHNPQQVHDSAAISSLKCNDSSSGPSDEVTRDLNSSIQPLGDALKFHTSTPIQSPKISRQLHRSNSHESLLSVSGMDLHTTSKHPALALRGNPSFFPRPPKRVSNTSIMLPSPSPIISKTNAIVPKASLTGEQTSVSLLSSVVSSNTRGNLRSVSDSASQIHSDAASTISASSESTVPSKIGASARTIGIRKRMGSWVREKWSTNTVDEPGNTPSSLTGGSLVPRPPGVNQSGPILGLRPPPPAPVSLHPENLNHDLLQESLLEE
ncbi:hypothetical protein TMEN_9810 [Trichophyton mentagrophytes]|uniref:Bicaudal D-related protein 1 n=1 Tax=Trichophyton interdigitale TaxID=101480 RepID=A0A9P4YFD1_9EURO|nr:Bicaudal D-related protein 1 [Trichophyton interdigitale]KAF3892851.1 Bicaudal D-related protein 1 [Trichophyton interdigitale]KAG8207845.1 Bicaudal D-related protein 1 [Trichophyton interdigitale]GBF67087.1 hypothetical protein TMEN_9810 [Trichophyton mentagrophytes]